MRTARPLARSVFFLPGHAGQVFPRGQWLPHGEVCGNGEGHREVVQ